MQLLKMRPRKHPGYALDQNYPAMLDDRCEITVLRFASGTISFKV